MNPIFESKTALRRKLADLPIGEKLTLLDALRDQGDWLVMNCRAGFG